MPRENKARIVARGEGILCVLGLFRLGLKGDCKLKDTATARRTVNADGPSHEFNKLLADCEPQPGPSMNSCGRSIRLYKGLENPRTVFLRDADPRVGDGETHANEMSGSSRDAG